MGKPVIGHNQHGVSEMLTSIFAEGLVAIGDTDAIEGKVPERARSMPPLSHHSNTLPAMLGATNDLYQSLVAE